MRHFRVVVKDIVSPSKEDYRTLGSKKEQRRMVDLSLSANGAYGYRVASAAEYKAAK